METRRDKTKNGKARRVFAARLAVVCAFAVCAGVLLFEGAEYTLSFRRESMPVTASAGTAERLIADEPDGRMDINAAEAEDLMTVPGIGPALARGILTLREERGGFRLLEELMDVNGIGEKRFMALKEFFFCPMQGNYLPTSPPSF